MKHPSRAWRAARTVIAGSLAALSGAGCVMKRVSTTGEAACCCGAPATSSPAIAPTMQYAGTMDVAAKVPGAPAVPGAHAASAAESKAVYEKFKSLAGDWNGASTKGWNERLSYKTIANGSAVLESSFDAHPGEEMLTLVHPDGDRLMLTHYCAAKNQPRLVLTQMEHGADGGVTGATFEFLDATNLASRDAGHMDKVVFTFNGDDSFTDRWTWYAKGTEAWMEEIVNTRVPAPAK